MADAFRGLTLKIGADTRQVNSAMMSIQHSARMAQKEARALDNALKLDPNNYNAINAKLSLVGDKASLAARKAQTIKNAMDNAKSSTIEFSNASGIASGKLEELANNSHGVWAAAQKVRDEYNHVDAVLERIYDAAAKVKAEQEHISFSKAVKSVQELAHGTDAERAKLVKLVQVAAMADKQLRIDLGYSGKNNMAESWDVAKIALSNYIAEHDVLQKDLEALNKVQAYKSLQNSATLAQMEVRRTAQEFVELKTKIYSLGKEGALEETISRLRGIDSVLDEVSAEVRETNANFAAMPKSIAAANAKIRAEEQEVQVLNEKAARYEQLLDKIHKDPAFDEGMVNANAFLAYDEASAKVEKLKINIDEARAEEEFFERAIKDIDNSEFKELGGSVEVAEKELMKARAQVLFFEQELEKADNILRKATMAKEARRAESALNGVKARLLEIDRATSRIKVWGQRLATLRTMGYGLYSTITPAIMIAGRYAIQAANDIDTAYRNMRKTVNGTEEEFEHLKQAALDYSSTHVTSANTILEIEAMGGQLGIAVDNLESFSEVVSNLDIATDIDAEDLAKYIGQLSNIMKDINQYKDDPVEYQKKITSFSDALVRLGNNSAAQESSIMKVMMRIASLGTISGFTTPQLLAISTAVAATGQGCEAAGTAISKTFSNIETAVGAGGESLEAFADVAGMSAEEFATAWNKDPMKAFDAFIKGLRRIDEEGGSVDRTLASLGINSVRQKQALMGLTNTYDVMTASLEMSQDAWDGVSTNINGKIEESGDAAREAQRKSEGFSGELSKMKNNAQKLAMELASGATPIITTLGAAFQSMTAAISATPPAFKTMLTLIAGLTASAGPALVAVGAVGAGLEQLSSIAVKFQGAKTIKSLNGLTSAMAAYEAVSVGVKKKAAHGVRVSLEAMESIGYGKIVAGLGAVAFAVYGLVASYQQSVEKAEKYKKATEDLGRMGLEFKHSWEITALGAGEVGAALDNTVESWYYYKDAAEKAIDTNAKFYDEINTKLDNTETNARLVQYYTDKITELSEKTNKSSKDIKLLQQYVGEYNKLTDSNFHVDEMTGALDVQTEALERNTQAFKLNAYAKAYSDLAAEGLKNIASMTVEYDKLTEDMLAKKKEVDAFGKNASDYYKLNPYDDDDGREYNADYAKAVAEYENVVKARYETWKSIQEEQKVVDSLLDKGAEASRAANGEQEAFEKLRYSCYDYMQALEDSGASVDVFADAAVDFSMDIDEFAAALSSAGISAKQFAAMGIEGFNNLWNAAGQDFDNLQTAINLLNQAGIDPKEMTVTEDGITDVDGKLWQLDLDAKTITDGEYTFSIEANSSSAEAAISEASSEGEEYDNTTYSADVDVENEEAMDGYEEAEDEGEEYDNTTYTAKADLDTQAAINALNSLESRLRNYDSSTYTATVNSQENAAGGVSSRAIKSAPRNASGGALNGIVTRATMTNRGWVGEAGDEAVFHMRNAGGAIIPLSNRQHVRPFARAVAFEMGGAWGSQQSQPITYTITVNASSDGDEIARKVTKAIRSQELMRGRR